MKRRSANTNTIVAPPPAIEAPPAPESPDINITWRAWCFAAPYVIFAFLYLYTRFLSPTSHTIWQQVTYSYVKLVNDAVLNNLLRGDLDDATKKIMIDTVKAAADMSFYGAVWVFGMSVVIAVWYPIPKTIAAWTAFGYVTCLLCTGLLICNAILSTWIDMIQ